MFADDAALIAAIAGYVSKEKGPLFMGKPDRWFDQAHWRCRNDHVSTGYLKSEARGGACCLAGRCGEFVYLTFPEDVEGPLP